MGDSLHSRSQAFDHHFWLKEKCTYSCTSHLQHWSWFLSSYSYGIEFKSTSAHGNADCLSQLSLSTTSNASSAASIQQIKTLPVTDVELPDVMSFLPKFCATLSLVGQFLFLTHFLHQNELTLEDCALWGA